MLCSGDSDLKGLGVFSEDWACLFERVLEVELGLIVAMATPDRRGAHVSNRERLKGPLLIQVGCLEVKSPVHDLIVVVQELVRKPELIDNALIVRAIRYCLAAHIQRELEL